MFPVRSSRTQQKLRLFRRINILCEEVEKIIIRLAVAASTAKVVYEVVFQHLLK
ncbi:MAG: hypothetical protein MN733_01255 [Nitrososphaera sp.]|nr:hypothetical protein [Nitrososphaera sp.]MCI0706091.1 hypothetical protein [Ignavibacteriota bacterium]